MPMRLLLLIIAAYLVGFALWPPRVMTITDEAVYLEQAMNLAGGRIGTPVIDPVTGADSVRIPDEYPLGTAPLLAIGLMIGGVAGAWWIPPIAWAAAVLLTGLLLRRQGLPVLPAALVGLFLPALFAGRLLMSDAPSAAIVAGALLCFFAAFEGSAAPDRRMALAFVAGLLAGLSTMFRETNALVLAPLCAGAVIRRERPAWPLFWGGLIGVAVRLLSSQLAFGSALGTRAAWSWGLDAFIGNLLIYGLALVVLFPLGLLAAFLYRGPRATELRITVVAYFLLFCIYEFRGQDSGFLKSLVLGPRFFLPLTPLLALGVGDVLARLAHGRRLPLRAAAATFAVACAAVAFAVHPVFHRWASARASIRDAITASTHDDQVVLTNAIATTKYIHPAYGPRTLADLGRLSDAQVRAILARDPDVAVIVLERFDSSTWTELNEATRARIRRLLPQWEVARETDFGSEGRLVVFTPR